jgi:glycerate kinase
LRPGIDIVLDAGGFNEHLQHASMVITGEGSLDAQTKSGKAVSGILRRSVQQQRPVAAVVGSMEGTPGEYIGPDRFIGVASLIDGVTSRGEAMRDARRLLRRRTAELIRSIIQ